MHQLRTCTPTSARCRWLCMIGAATCPTWISPAPHLPTAMEKIMDRLPVKTTCDRNNTPSIHSCHRIGPFPCRCLCLTLCTASVHSWIRPQHWSCAQAAQNCVTPTLVTTPVSPLWHLVCLGNMANTVCVQRTLTVSAATARIESQVRTGIPWLLLNSILRIFTRRSLIFYFSFNWVWRKALKVMIMGDFLLWT